jgi:hypothetical protein
MVVASMDRAFWAQKGTSAFDGAKSEMCSMLNYLLVESEHYLARSSFAYHSDRRSLVEFVS